MKVAMGQFAVSREWQENTAICRGLMQDALAAGTDLLVLPEGVKADTNWTFDNGRKNGIRLVQE